MFATRLSPLAAALFLGLLGLCGCGGTATGGLGPALRPDATTGTGACVPGQQSACACPNSSNVGAQICNADGHSFGPCMGCDGSDAQLAMPDDASNDGGATRDGALLEAASHDAGHSNCAPPDGGLPCDPGQVSCGGSPCPTSTSFCCETVTGSSGTCDQIGATCTQSEVHCDEGADCDGSVCCLAIAVSFATSVKATCHATCPTGTYRLCRSNTECGAGQSCIPQTCLGGGSTEACTTVPGCTPK
jgi:hypothetical protein